MAQDLLIFRPGAVVASDSGYLMVDYDQIDVKMMTLQAYLESCGCHGVGETQGAQGRSRGEPAPSFGSLHQ
jgi:hypothetical protein